MESLLQRSKSVWIVGSAFDSSTVNSLKKLIDAACLTATQAAPEVHFIGIGPWHEVSGAKHLQQSEVYDLSRYDTLPDQHKLNTAASIYLLLDNGDPNKETVSPINAFFQKNGIIAE